MRRRCSGTTTGQILRCPRGSVYLWPNSALQHARDMARELGRDDIQFYEYRSFINRIRGRIVDEAIIIDHACFEMGLV